MVNVSVANLTEKIENRQASGVIQYAGDQGDLVAINSDGDVVEADATNGIAGKARGVLIGEAHDPQYVSVTAQLTAESEYDLVGEARKGYFEYGVRIRNSDQDWNFTPGADIYLAEGGGYTETAPATSGSVVQRVGYAKPGATEDGVANEVVIHIDQAASETVA